MNENFWNSLKKPIYILAPMEDVTDTVFREVVMRNSSPENLHVVFTEFVSVDSICASTSKEVFLGRLHISGNEREVLEKNGVKIVAQIWGSDPEKFYQAGKLISENFSFDGIDINMGCPVKKVVKNKCCSALILEPERAVDIIHATHSSTHLPVSVKTRTGYNEVATVEWSSRLLSAPISALSVHGRTQKMLSEGKADWEEIRKVVQLRDSLDHPAKIIGNGDVMSINDAQSRCAEFQVDGVMIGRGIFHNPWLFSEQSEVDLNSRFDLLLFHLSRFEVFWGRSKNFNILKRFFKIYLSGFEGAAHIRAALMEVRNAEEAREAICRFRTEFNDRLHQSAGIV